MSSKVTEQKYFSDKSSFSCSILTLHRDANLHYINLLCLRKERISFLSPTHHAHSKPSSTDLLDGGAIQVMTLKPSLQWSGSYPDNSRVFVFDLARQLVWKATWLRLDPDSSWLEIRSSGGVGGWSLAVTAPAQAHLSLDTLMILNRTFDRKLGVRRMVKRASVTLNLCNAKHDSATGSTG